MRSRFSNVNALLHQSPIGKKILSFKFFKEAVLKELSTKMYKKALFLASCIASILKKGRHSPGPRESSVCVSSFATLQYFTGLHSSTG